MSQAFKVVPKGDVALVEFDLPNEKVNKFSSPVMMEFNALIDSLAKSAYKAVVIISRKPKIFIAGADINEIADIRDPKDAKAKGQAGQNIFNKSKARLRPRLDEIREKEA